MFKFVISCCLVVITTAAYENGSFAPGAVYAEVRSDVRDWMRHSFDLYGSGNRDNDYESEYQLM